MIKEIKISNKNYKMKSSAYTQFAYKNDTGRSLLKDLQSLIDLKKDNSDDYNVDDLDEVTTLLLKIAYIMVKEADESQTNDYISFIKDIDSLYDDTKWINEALELACTPLSGRLQAR